MECDHLWSDEGLPCKAHVPSPTQVLTRRLQPVGLTGTLLGPFDWNALSLAPQWHIEFGEKAFVLASGLTFLCRSDIRAEVLFYGWIFWSKIIWCHSGRKSNWNRCGWDYWLFLDIPTSNCIYCWPAHSQLYFTSSQGFSLTGPQGNFILTYTENKKWHLADVP